MPDLQSELSKIASAWDSHEQAIRTPQHSPQPQEKAMKYAHTGVLTRDVFALIKDNPSDFTPSAVATFMENRGYKNNSIHAIITQMKKAGVFVLNDDGRLYTTAPEYKPFANPYSATKKSLREKAKAKAQAKATSAAKEQAEAWAGIAALQPATTPKKETVKMFTAKEVLSVLNVTEAYALYAELSKMFGGVK